MPKKLFTLLFFTILFIPGLYSQNYFFRDYSVEQGLPQSSAYCLLQDSRGFIWVGTNEGGVARFDGQTFETFNKSTGLSDNVVRSLYEDSKGNIWIGTDNGLTLYDGYSFKIIGKEQGLKGTSVLKILESKNGLIWAATNDGGLARISMKDSLSVSVFSTDDGLVSDFIFDIYEDQGKNLWLGMVGGINIIEFDDSTQLKIKKIDKPDFKSESVITILSLEAEKNGTIWFGSYGSGLYKASLNNDLNNIVVEASPLNERIPEMTVWDMLINSNGELWLATDKNGIVKQYDGKITGFFNKDNGLQSNQIVDILRDSRGNMWFATFGQGIMMYPGEKFISYTERNGIKGTQIIDVLFTPGNIFYVATEEGLMQFIKEGSNIRRLNLFTSANGLNSEGVNTLENSGKDQILIGTKNGINILRGSKITEFAGNSSLDNTDISSLVAGSNDNIWVGTAGGYGRIFGDKLFFMDQDAGLINGEIQSIIEDKSGKVWLGTLAGLARLDGSTYTDFDEKEGLTTLKINSLVEDPSGNILIGTIGGGIFRFDTKADSVPISVYATKGVLSSNTINSLKFISDTILIAGNDKGFDLIVVGRNQEIKRVIHNSIKDGFPGGENIPNSISADDEGFIWFGTNEGLLRYNPAMDLYYSELPESYITGIKLFYKDVDWNAKQIKQKRFTSLPENLVLSHDDNHLTFTYTGLSYNNPDELEFSFFLENQSKEWSPYNKNRDMLFSGLTPGNYTFKIKARNKHGIVGNPAEFKFVIRPPFWKTVWFLLPASCLLIVLIIFIFRIRERNLINEKIKLEKIVEERTREVVEQKDEIARQRDVVTYQKKEITDSIHYAERIQRAVLPEEKILSNSFPEYFVLFRPKDIVSGDFYWMSQKGDNIIFAAVDCTGHGVPGAFMSMLGVSFLNKLVNESGIITPSQILDSLRENIIISLKQKGSIDTTKDGMDVAICSIDMKNMHLQFAGANNPLFIIRKENEEYVVLETRGDKMPVGFYSRMENFTNNEIDLLPGDSLYMFSDGFLDQFGGPEGRKFMKPRFKQMLIDNQGLSMSEQRGAFNNILENWINHEREGEDLYGQIDDVILIGVRV